jgi:hypothetical protein
MSNGNPFKFNFGLGVDDEEDEYKRGLFGSVSDDLRNKIWGEGAKWNSTMSQSGKEVYNSMWSAEKSRLLGKKQKLFDIAAKGGAKDGGTAVAGGGTTGLGYADPVDFTKTFPGAMSKEEEEYLLALRGPVPGLVNIRGIG